MPKSKLLTPDRHIDDATATAPDLTAGRAVQNFFLRIPGTTPGIFLFIVFGTTRSSRQKIKELLPKQWQESSPLSCFGRRPHPDPSSGTGITIQRSLTVTSAARTRASHLYDNEDLSESTSDIWMKDMPPPHKRADSALSFQIANMKPLPLAPGSPSSGGGLRTTVTCSSGTPTKKSPGMVATVTAFNELAPIEERRRRKSMDGGLSALSRTTTNESLQVPDEYDRLGVEHSDDSGPILPIQRPEVRFSKDVVEIVRQAGGRVRHSRNFSRPKI